MAILLVFLTNTSLLSDPTIFPYEYKIKKKEVSKYKIFLKDNLLFCSGKDPAGQNNNMAARMILRGELSRAEKKLLFCIKMAPLFLPYHYNIAAIYIFQKKPDRAIFHLKKAQLIFPQYYGTYIQLAHAYERKNKPDMALIYYRKSLERYSRNPRVYALMGDIYFKRKQYRSALAYYRGSLKIKKNYANGLLGEAKIFFVNEKYIKTINKLKSIDLKEDYDIDYHYYLAEASYKIGDYKTAYREYKKLILNRNNRFFLTHSFLLIKHKMKMSKRFTEK